MQGTCVSMMTNSQESRQIFAAAWPSEPTKVKRLKSSAKPAASLRHACTTKHPAPSRSTSPALTLTPNASTALLAKLRTSVCSVFFLHRTSYNTYVGRGSTGCI